METLDSVFNSGDVTRVRGGLVEGGGRRGDGGRLLIFLKRAKVMKELEHLHPFPHPHRSVWAVSVFISSAVVAEGVSGGRNEI